MAILVGVCCCGVLVDGYVSWCAFVLYIGR